MRFIARLSVVLVIILGGVVAYLSLPPTKFPENKVIRVESGEGISAIAKELKAEHIVRSAVFFEAATVLLSGDKKIIAGDYNFNQPISIYTVVSRLMHGKFNLAPIKITVPEGLSMRQIAGLFSEKFADFSVADFLKNSAADEGYLFPDTYFFAPDVKAEDVIKTMRDNFEHKTAVLESKIAASGKTRQDFTIMASMLEEEGKNSKDWQIIAGILWKRLKIGMPLQVDSTLGYVIGKGSSGLTAADLKMNSPYNTYVKKGLPPTPISNPGLETIEAAIDSTSTPYFYYLSDSKGEIHYAATFAEHIINRQKYLK